MEILKNYTKTTMKALNENVITVTSGTFYINRENPKEISYGYVDPSKWRPVALNTYANTPPPPNENQIKYVLEGNPFRAAYEIKL